MNKLEDLFVLGDKINVEIEGSKYVKKFLEQAFEEGFVTDYEANDPRCFGISNKAFYVLTHKRTIYEGYSAHKRFIVFYRRKKESNDPDTIVIDYKPFADGKDEFVYEYKIGTNSSGFGIGRVPHLVSIAEKQNSLKMKLKKFRFDREISDEEMMKLMAESRKGMYRD